MFEVHVKASICNAAIQPCHSAHQLEHTPGRCSGSGSNHSCNKHVLVGSAYIHRLASGVQRISLHQSTRCQADLCLDQGAVIGHPQPWPVSQYAFNQSINYTFPALLLGVSKEIVYFCPPSLSILSQPCPRWQDPKGIQILST